MKIRIRQAVAADYAALCWLFEQLDRHHVEILPECFQAFPSPARPRDLLECHIQGPDSVILVAETEAGIVGMLELRKENAPPYPMFRTRSFALLANMAVEESHRRMGVGRDLMAEARRWALERGLSSIRLKVYAANEGTLEFYRREGFHPMELTMELECARTETGTRPSPLPRNP